MIVKLSDAVHDETLVSATLSRKEWVIICGAAFTAGQDIADPVRRADFIERLRKLTRQVQGQ